MQSILEREIFEQPEKIRGFLDREEENARRITNTLRGKFSYIVIAARGTSDNAARYAQYLYGLQHNTQVALATPSLFTMYGAAPEMKDALVVGISQSGQSPDIVAVLAEGKKQGRPTLAITNDADSPLARTAEFVLPLNAGGEKAVAATKTYTTSLAALALLSVSLDEDQQRMDALRSVPDHMQCTLEGLQEALKRVERYRYMEQCAVIGRGLNYATAFEVALKVKELSQTVAEPYSSADFRHGPIATARPGFPVIVIAPSGAVAHDIHALIDDLRRRKAELLVISDDPKALEAAELALPFSSGLPEWLTPLVAVVPGQRFAMQLTIEKGKNPDQPEGITKVTETL